MKLLLDTHIWLWSTLDRARISRRVIGELQNPANELWLSPISLWEVLTLCQRGRLSLEPNPRDWITNMLLAVPMLEAQITYDVAQETDRVQLPHRDPADRFLVATARVFNLTLVTADEQLLKTKQVTMMANR
jgi:PIN domain nuclease of toxin-antitoxin system